MYIIDLSYFKGNINVPNVEELNSGNAVKLETYVDKYGRLVMQYLLGYELFLDFDSYIENGELKPTAPQIYKDLVDGNGSDFREKFDTHQKNQRMLFLEELNYSQQIAFLQLFLLQGQYRDVFLSFRLHLVDTK